MFNLMNVSTSTRYPQRNSFYKSRQPVLPLNPDNIGRVKFFDTIKGYGYISYDFGKEFYFHKSSIRSASLKAGDEVCFHLSPSKKFASLFEAVELRKVYRSKDGQPIFNRVNSHLHSGIEPILGRIAEQIHCQDRVFIQQEISFDAVIGKNILVRLNAGDEIVYAVRKGRTGYTKFVLNREPEECRTVAIVLKGVESGYLIMTAYIGELSGFKFWDEDATAYSLSIWDNHALIYGHEDVYENTFTEVSPWGLRTAA